jgi:ankyrin repeat protein
VRIIRMLIKHGADINSVSEKAQAPAIVQAAMLGKCAVLAVLLQAGAHFDAALQYKSLSCAFWHLDDAAAAEVVKALLPYCSSLDEPGAADGHNALSYALSHGKVQAARALHAGGADVHCIVQHRTMAHMAAQSGSIAALKWVQSVGVDLRASSNVALLPLHCACRLNKPDAVKYLLDLPGAADDVHASTTREQQTPLFYAVSNSADSVVQLLLQRGAAVDVRCSAGMTPLMRARAASVVKLLLSAGADVAAVGASGLTVLHYLARCGAAAGAVCLIMKAGVDPTAVDVTGSTAAHVAGISGHFALGALLSRAAEDRRKKQTTTSSSSSSSSSSTSSSSSSASTASDSSSEHIAHSSASSSSSAVASTDDDSTHKQQAEISHDDAASEQQQRRAHKAKQPCANCSKLTTKRCKRCAAVYYCSAECQKVCFKDAKHRAQCEAKAAETV